jgi:hypothetical protein
MGLLMQEVMDSCNCMVHTATYENPANSAVIQDQVALIARRSHNCVAIKKGATHDSTHKIKACKRYKRSQITDGRPS